LSVDIGSLLESSYTALIVAAIFGAAAFGGKLSAIASRLLLLAAWAIAVFGLRYQPVSLWLGGAAILGVSLLLLAYWFRPEIIPLYTGVLTPKKTTLLFSARDGGTVPKIQIGQSGVFLVGPGGQIGALLFPALQVSDFKVESVDGKIKVSTRVVGGDGKLIAEIIQNEWKVSPTEAWDRNYSDDVLEVKDSRGLVILQVRALPDRIQVQGAWWTDMGPPNGVRRLWIWHDPNKSGAQLVFAPREDPNPIVIRPMFRYPGDRHLGELSQ
jgi:hypothetical protein